MMDETDEEKKLRALADQHFAECEADPVLRALYFENIKQAREAMISMFDIPTPTRCAHPELGREAKRLVRGGWMGMEENK